MPCYFLGVNIRTFEATIPSSRHVKFYSVFCTLCVWEAEVKSAFKVEIEVDKNYHKFTATVL